MGNYRFRFSDMIPNAWFYKLNHTSKPTKQSNSHCFKKSSFSVSQPIKSKFSDIHFPHELSSKQRSQRKTVYKPSPKPVVGDHEEEEDQVVSGSNSCKYCKFSSSSTDIIIDVKGETYRKRIKTSKVTSNSVGIRRSKIRGCAGKSTSLRNYKSFAVVKSSMDPQKDFRDSMEEMILENNLRSSKDLEDLLACLLSLNPKQYHHLIVKAFEQIWYQMTHLRL